LATGRSKRKVRKVFEARHAKTPKPCGINMAISTFLFGLRNMADLGHYFQQNPLYKSQPFFFDRQVAKKKS
jgi:hypothetical protein